MAVLSTKACRNIPAAKNSFDAQRAQNTGKPPPAGVGFQKKFTVWKNKTPGLAIAPSGERW
jgi:hypothetical protein